MFIFLSITTNAIAQVDPKIEIFEVQKDKVVATVEVTPEIRQDVEAFLKGISGVYKKLNPVPTTGFMVKVPLTPAVVIENKFFKGSIVEVIVVFSLQENPYLMAFDNNNQFYAFTFEGDADSFLEKLNYNPRTSY
jgi:hypothetical protein